MTLFQGRHDLIEVALKICSQQTDRHKEQHHLS